MKLYKMDLSCAREAGFLGVVHYPKCVCVSFEVDNFSATLKYPQMFKYCSMVDVKQLIKLMVSRPNQNREAIEKTRAFIEGMFYFYEPLYLFWKKRNEGLRVSKYLREEERKAKSSFTSVSKILQYYKDIEGEYFYVSE